MKLESLGQTFRLGIWSVKPQNVSSFIKAWQVSGDWLVRRLPDQGGAVLLRDEEDPSMLISFASVSDPEKVEELMASAEYQDLWADVMHYCDEVKPHRMRVVGSVGGQIGD